MIPVRRCLGFALAILFPVLAPADTVGTPWTGEPGITQSVASIMKRQRTVDAQGPRAAHVRPFLRPNRRGLPQNPNSPAAPSVALPTPAQVLTHGAFTPQTLGTSFTGATLADTGAFPPDTMGAVGPAQFIVAINGRIRTFNKTTGDRKSVV